jgi:hypothetical protein
MTPPVPTPNAVFSKLPAMAQAAALARPRDTHRRGPLPQLELVGSCRRVADLAWRVALSRNVRPAPLFDGQSPSTADTPSTQT